MLNIDFKVAVPKGVSNFHYKFKLIMFFIHKMRNPTQDIVGPGSLKNSKSNQSNQNAIIAISK